jgi:hypothetical protein
MARSILFQRWKKKIQQKKMIRDRVIAQQRIGIVILNKVRRRCHEWLREAFVHWGEQCCSRWQKQSEAIDSLVSIGNPHHATPSHSFDTLNDLSADWRSEISGARSFTRSVLSRRSHLPMTSAISEETEMRRQTQRSERNLIVPKSLQQRPSPGVRCESG